MIHTSAQSRKRILIIILLGVLAGLLHTMPERWLHSRYITVPIYLFIFAYWTVSVYQRILHPHIRRYLETIGAMMLLLMVFRTHKYAFLKEFVGLDMYAQYGYSLCYAGMGVFGLLVALEADEEYPRKGRARALILGYGVLSFLLIATNDLHHMAYIPVGTGPFEATKYRNGPLYWVNAAFLVGMIILTFILVVRQSRRILPLRSALVPGASLATLAIFYIFYYLGDNSSPLFLDRPMYNPPEMMCLCIMAFWESCIQIGLLPSCSGYRELVRLSGVGMEFRDVDGQASVRSDILGRDGAKSGQGEDAAVYVVHEHAVRGGSIRYYEDRTRIRKLNERLDRRIEQLSEQGELIAAENELREKRLRVTIQNRLYDQISTAVQPAIRRIESRIERIEDGTSPDPKADLAWCTLMGAFVKRRANLELIGTEKKEMALEELYYSVRESLEEVRLLGVQSTLFFPRSAQSSPMASPETVTSLYERFETVLEKVLPLASSIIAHIDAANSPGQNVCLRLEIRGRQSEEAALAAMAGTLADPKTHEDVTRIEEGVLYVWLGGEGASCALN